MKKSLIAAVFTLGLTGNVFAECDTTPYNAPEELQPACTEDAPVVSDGKISNDNKIKVKRQNDSEKKDSADGAEKSVPEKSSQSNAK